MPIKDSQNISLYPIDGKVLSSGGSLNVKDGVLAVVSTKDVTSSGKKVLSSFAGLPKSKTFQILLGKKDLPITRGTNNKPYESLPFSLEDIVDVRVVTPKQVGQKVDDFIIGYNGKPGTEIVIGDRTATEIEITLCGDPMYHLGYHDGKVTVKLMLESPYLDEDGNPKPTGDAVTNQEIVEKAVERFNRMTLIGGAPITDYVEALVVNSLNGGLDELDQATSYTFYTLTLTDNGDNTAYARVQAQYPTYSVVRTERVNDTQSVYTILAPAGTSLSAYTTTLAQKLKGCDDCPAGYDALTGGVVYRVSIEDDGADLTTTVDDLPGFVTGTAAKVAQNGGVGVYTLVTDDAITDAEIVTFKAASATKATAVIELVGAVDELCEDDTVTSTSWVTGTSCTAVGNVYRITLPDDECGDTRLAELQAAYPDLTIAVDTPNLTSTITLSGTSGTGNITINGVDYLVTYDTSTTVTAAAFVTDHAADILAATGAVVTSSGAVITIVDDIDSYPTISFANATGNLAATESALSGSGTAASALCQTTYRTFVTSNVVCAECSDEFRALFTTEAPSNFGLYSWYGEAKTYNEDAKMGIRFRGKEFILSGTEVYRDDMPFYYTSTRLSVAGGQPNFIAESWNNIGAPFALKVLSIASEPEALGAHQWENEDMSRVYFDGLERFEGNNYAKWLWGQETKLAGTAQVVDYQITIDRKKYFQVLPHASERITYHIITEVGRHESVETLLNSLAAAAGLNTVQAFAK
jgi:hypothetical protein